VNWVFGLTVVGFFFFFFFFGKRTWGLGRKGRVREVEGAPSNACHKQSVCQVNFIYFLNK